MQYANIALEREKVVECRFVIDISKVNFSLLGSEN
jgi:hypothetical protein